MQTLIESIPMRPVDLIFGGRRESIASNTCICCGKPANAFRDELSRKEFSISGLCQSCQDKVFGENDLD